jgi:hypothetical protein
MAADLHSGLEHRPSRQNDAHSAGSARTYRHIWIANETFKVRQPAPRLTAVSCHSSKMGRNRHQWLDPQPALDRWAGGREAADRASRLSLPVDKLTYGDGSAPES